MGPRMTLRERLRDLMLKSFPPETITTGKLVCCEDDNIDRVDTELRASGIYGKVWTDISLLEARGTADVLYLISSSSLRMIIGGYIQWLVDPEEADHMLDLVPNFLMERTKSDACGQLLSGDRRVLSEAFSLLAEDYQQSFYDQEDVSRLVACAHAMRTD